MSTGDPVAGVRGDGTSAEGVPARIRCACTLTVLSAGSCPAGPVVLAYGKSAVRFQAVPAIPITDRS